LRIRKQRENEIIYVGIANGKGKLYERLRQEFRQKSRGTFFRSIGATIGAIPREGQASPRNYMFYGEEKEKIINFINENLLVAYEIIHKPNNDIEIKEQKLIKKLCPIFNITHNPNKSVILKLARAKCREIAGR
jgi:hypothetical protein